MALTIPQFDGQGVIPILPTPFLKDGKLDLNSIRVMVTKLMDYGVSGFTVLGVLGEANRLDWEEKKAVVMAAVDAVNGRLPICVGASEPGTDLTLRLCKAAEEWGASALMIAPAVKDTAATMELYQSVADEVSLPIVLQDHPASTGVDLDLDFILRILSEVNAVRCIKMEAPPTWKRISYITNSCGSWDGTILGGLGGVYGHLELNAGSCGFMTGFSFLEVLREMWSATVDSDLGHMLQLYQRYSPHKSFGVYCPAGRTDILSAGGGIPKFKVRSVYTADANVVFGVSRGKQNSAYLSQIMGTNIGCALSCLQLIHFKLEARPPKITSKSGGKPNSSTK